MIINSDFVDLIIEKLEILETEYQQNKALILTEDDLKCQLFRYIYDIFPRNLETFNSGITGCSVHSEIKFFDEDDKLTLIPDLVVVDPGNISIFHSTEYTMKRKGPKYNKIPPKNFAIGGGAILIELKFCRNRIGVNATDVINFQSDVAKMHRIKSIIESRSNGDDKVYGIFVLFNKTNNGSEIFQSFKNGNSNDEDIRIFYGSGLVNFSEISKYPFDFND